MLVRYVAIRPLFKEKIFGSCGEERMVKREKTEKQWKSELNESAYDLGQRRDR